MIYLFQMPETNKLHIERTKTMKEKYEAAEMEVVEFETEDVITSSGNGFDNTGDIE